MPSYYKIINGQKYDRKLLEKAQALTKGQGDGRISLKDAETLYSMVTDGRGITNIERRSLQYLLQELNWSEKAARWMTTQVDLSPDAESEKYPIATIIWEEFGLAILQYQIALTDIVEQEALPQNQVPFNDALRTALNTILTSNSEQESPRFLIQEVFGLFSSDDPDAAGKITDKLKDFLEKATLQLLPNEDWSDFDREFDFYPPEEREKTTENWIFYLTLPSLSDHLFWVIVPRDGKREAYVYGFN